MLIAPCVCYHKCEPIEYCGAQFEFVDLKNMDSNDVKLVQTEYEVLPNYKVSFLLIKFESSFLLWVGQSPPNSQLINLALGISENCTSILGATTDLLSPSLASKLSVKYNSNRPVYVSYNYSLDGSNDNELVLKINEKIIEFLNDNLKS